jgi:hypothetical protein
MLFPYPFSLPFYSVFAYGHFSHKFHSFLSAQAFFTLRCFTSFFFKDGLFHRKCLFSGMFCHVVS